MTEPLRFGLVGGVTCVDEVFIVANGSALKKETGSTGATLFIGLIFIGLVVVVVLPKTESKVGALLLMVVLMVDPDMEERGSLLGLVF